MTSTFVSLYLDISGQLERILTCMMVLLLLRYLLYFFNLIYVYNVVIYLLYFFYLPQDDDNNFDDTDYDSDAGDSVKTSLTINIAKSD